MSSATQERLLAGGAAGAGQRDVHAARVWSVLSRDRWLRAGRFSHSHLGKPRFTSVLEVHGHGDCGPRAGENLMLRLRGHCPVWGTRDLALPVGPDRWHFILQPVLPSVEEGVAGNVLGWGPSLLSASASLRRCWGSIQRHTLFTGQALGQINWPLPL